MATKTYTLEMHTFSKPRLVLNDPNGQAVFTGDTHTFKPHVVLHHPSGTGDYATATFHSFSSRIDCTLANNSFELSKGSGMFRPKYEFKATNGERLYWKSSGAATLICYDQKDQVVAKCQRESFFGKSRSIEVVGDMGNDHAVLTTAIYMIVLMVRRSNNAGAAGAAGGGAGA
ncbi:hypothetical protein K461DRAFT_282054 [Myriangium duriaei CBS 260.36]|uniref:Uncharacterized protein n=1 Tax=Myriangium duriaei CBS 260.36 TaxID=1168546 RepID=A0A9P4MH52_9PEZI|nr:hypothetical protein K461DRAFT_282054 [Myriangium duriaei CBS 260.36]